MDDDINVKSFNFKTSLLRLLPGAIGNVVSHLFSYPFCTIKTKLQRAQYKNTYSAFTQTIKNDGFLSLYRGMLAPIGTSLVVRPVEYVIYENFKKDMGHIQAGCIAGIYCGIAGSPMHIIKVNMQSTKASEYSSIFDFTKKHYNIYGISGFFKALPINIATNVAHAGVYLGTYGNVRDYTKTDYPILSSILGGSISSLVSTTLIFPIDSIRVNIQTSQIKMTVRSTFTSIYKDRGVLGFWKGVLPIYIKALPSSAIGMFVYEYIRKEIFPTES